MAYRGFTSIPLWAGQAQNGEKQLSSTIRVLVGLLSCMNRKRNVKKSVAQLAKICCCSQETVRHALDALEAQGLLRSNRKYRWCPVRNRLIYDAKVYRIRKFDADTATTAFPRELLELDVTHGAFVVLLYLYHRTGCKGSCYPSIRRIARDTGLSPATVKRALGQLQSRKVQAIVRLWQKKGGSAKRQVRGAWYGCNTYYLTAWKSKNRRRTNAFVGGGLIFREPTVSNNITLGYYLAEKKIGVGEFGNLNNFRCQICEIYFDGTAYRVVATEDNLC